MRIIVNLVFLLISLSVLADGNEMLSLGAYVQSNSQSIPSEAVSVLESRMRRAIVADGMVDDNAAGRFALIAKCDILDKDVIPSTPPRISQKLEISFAVVDILEDKTYGYSYITVSGIGTNETKAYSSAFQKISIQNSQLKDLLTESKEKILEYYSTSCPQILSQAQTLARTNRFDEAIFSLMSVPAICSDCHNQCRELAVEIYQNKIDTQCQTLLEQMKNQWALSSSAESASKIVEILNKADPRSNNYSEVIAFRNSVAAKLAADKKREWDFQMKQYEDNMAFKNSIVDACKSIGEIFAQNFKIPQINFIKRH